MRSRLRHLSRLAARQRVASALLAVVVALAAASGGASPRTLADGSRLIAGAEHPALSAATRADASLGRRPDERAPTSSAGLAAALALPPPALPPPSARAATFASLVPICPTPSTGATRCSRGPPPATTAILS